MSFWKAFMLGFVVACLVILIGFTAPDILAKGRDGMPSWLDMTGMDRLKSYNPPVQKDIPDETPLKLVPAPHDYYPPAHD